MQMRFFISILIVCLLSSCASINKGVLIKRKYNKGYHIDLASHKRTPPLKEDTRSVPVSNEAPEVVIVPKKSNGTIAPPVYETKNETTASPGSIVKCALPQKSSGNNAGGFSIKEKLKDQAIRSSKRSKGLSDGQVAVGVIGFIVLTIIYFLAIIIKSPGFPIGLAIIVAMIGALLTLLTGVLFI
jgi:hypothetical protein